MNRVILAALMPLFLIVIAVPAQAAWLWSPESGKWTNVKDVPEDTPQAQFSVGKQYYDDEDYQGALGEFDKVIRHYPNDRFAAEAQFFKGLIFEKTGDIGKASEAFKTLIDRYPYSNRLNDAIEHEYELAEAMLDGEKTKFLGMAIIPAEDVAAELYDHIVRNAPFGPYGVKAQFRKGDAYLAMGDFAAAEEAYQAVIDNYPDSEWAPKARYKLAKVSHRAAFEQTQHTERTEEALNRYEGFKKAYPDSYLQLEADSAIQELRQRKAKSIFDIAKFYYDRKKETSAKIYFEDIVRDFPETEEAKMAADYLNRIAGGPGIPVELAASEEAPKKFLGIFPVNDEPKEEAPAEMKEEKAPKRFLGIFPMEEKVEEEVQEEPAEESEEADRPKFLGIF